MAFGMSHRIKPKEKYVRISIKESWHNLDGLLKNKELWSYVHLFLNTFLILYRDIYIF